jgi:hypothetical protein
MDSLSGPALGALCALGSGAGVGGHEPARPHAGPALQLASLKYAGVVVATVLSSTAPMFAIPLGFFFLGERLTIGAMLGSAVTLLGIALLHA